MRSGTPSRTSQGTTAVRAREMRTPAADRIGHDPYAVHFLAWYRGDRKTLFIWEGVIYYLTSDAVDASLSFVTRNSGSGSSIIFDYFPRSVIDGTCKSREARSLVKLVERMGEPLLLRDRGWGAPAVPQRQGLQRLRGGQRRRASPRSRRGGRRLLFRPTLKGAGGSM